MSDGRGQQVQVSGRTLNLTNLDKVLYPETGTTKAEVIAYYADIAPVLLPLLRDRPITRKHWPDGVAGSGKGVFFAKNLPKGAPDWIRRFSIEHSDGPNWYPLADCSADLVWLSQLAALELHVPQWRFDSAGVPLPADRLVLDLDPGPGVDLSGCAEVATWVRAELSQLGLDSFPVTSGSKGIHLYAQLDRQAAEPAAIARQLAERLQRAHPTRVTAVMKRSERAGKVFLDWSQNHPAKTTISPYSLRGRAHPWVAAPRTWDELAEPGLRHLELDEVLSRVAAGLNPLAALAGSARPETELARPRPTDPMALPPEPGRTSPTPARKMMAASGIAAADRTRYRPPPPMLASPPDLIALGSGQGWAFEMKWDGIRAIILLQSGTPRLFGRRGREETDRYPELLADLTALPCDQAILDGEIIALDDTGRPSFELLQPRINLSRPDEIAAARRRTPVQLVLFDLLELNGHSLLSESYQARRGLLESLAPPATSRVQIPPAVPGDLAGALQTSQSLGLEGVVAKRTSSPYETGRRSDAWLKFKHQHSQAVVVVGWRPGQNGRDGSVGSLLLAIPGLSGLEYVGRVGSGFSQAALTEALRLLEPLSCSNPTLSLPPEDAANSVWVLPELVGEVSYTERTTSGRLRTPVWLRWRPDLTAEDVHWE